MTPFLGAQHVHTGPKPKWVSAGCLTNLDPLWATPGPHPWPTNPKPFIMKPKLTKASKAKLVAKILRVLNKPKPAKPILAIDKPYPRPNKTKAQHLSAGRHLRYPVEHTIVVPAKAEQPAYDVVTIVAVIDQYLAAGNPFVSQQHTDNTRARYKARNLGWWRWTSTVEHVRERLANIKRAEDDYGAALDYFVKQQHQMLQQTRKLVRSGTLCVHRVPTSSDLLAWSARHLQQLAKQGFNSVDIKRPGGCNEEVSLLDPRVFCHRHDATFCINWWLTTWPAHFAQWKAGAGWHNSTVTRIGQRGEVVRSLLDRGRGQTTPPVTVSVRNLETLVFAVQQFRRHQFLRPWMKLAEKSGFVGKVGDIITLPLRRACSGPIESGHAVDPRCLGWRLHLEDMAGNALLAKFNSMDSSLVATNEHIFVPVKFKVLKHTDGYAGTHYTTIEVAK